MHGLNSLLRPPNVFLTLGVISISAATFSHTRAKCGLVFVVGSPATKNRECFWGRSQPFFSLVLFLSDTSRIWFTDFRTEASAKSMRRVAEVLPTPKDWVPHVSLLRHEM